MARPERPLDPATSAVAVFANRLRQLRQDAGSPSYRSMAAHTHFAASTLSEAAAGRRMPTLEVTLAYVQACGGDPHEWQQLWQTTATTAEPLIASTKTEIHNANQIDGLDTTRTRWLGTTRTRWRVGWLAAAATLGGLATIIVVGLALSGATPGLPRSSINAASRTPADANLSAASPIVADGADPKQSGCAADASSIATAKVVEPSGTVYGTIELRYAKACQAAWARYTPSTTGPQPTTVTISISRPQPIGNAAVTFIVHDGAIYSDLELFKGGCLQATAAVISNDRVVATAQTDCSREPA